MKALPKILLALTAVAALSVAGPASVQADTTYRYTGNPFTTVLPPYTTSDFVTAMVTLASPLPPNNTTAVTPLAFSISDGQQTITNSNSQMGLFSFTTGPTGNITGWNVDVSSLAGSIQTEHQGITTADEAAIFGIAAANNIGTPGTWVRAAVPDAGSSLALVSLSLIALAGAARQFKRAAA